MQSGYSLQHQHLGCQRLTFQKGRGEAHCLSCLPPAGLGLRQVEEPEANQQGSVYFDMEMVLLLHYYFAFP